MSRQRNSANPIYTFLSLGVFIGGCGVVLLLFQPPNSPGFVLSACSALLGLALVVGAALIIRRGAR